AIVAICGIALAGETARIAGNHLKGVRFTKELPDTQLLQGQVVMAVTHRVELTQLVRDLHNRDSPLYHKWLTPEQFADRFGPSSAQMRAVAAWLGGRGLPVTSVDRLTRSVHYRGSYAQIKTALDVRIVTNGKSFANLGDPNMPPELASTVVSIEGLSRDGETPRVLASDAIVSTCTVASKDPPCNNAPYFGPGDLYTYYNETPVI